MRKNQQSFHMQCIMKNENNCVEVSAGSDRIEIQSVMLSKHGMWFHQSLDNDGMLPET